MTSTSMQPVALRSTPSPFRTVAWWLLQLLLVAGLASAIVPILPHMPESGLDPSWRMAMNHAVAEGMDLGRDVAFTQGPYVSVYTGEYHPATDRLAMTASIYLVLSFSFVLLLTGWRDRRLAGLALLAATLPLGVYPHDNPLMAYPLLAGLFAFLASERGDRAAHRFSPVTTALVFAPFGLLALVKGSLATLCIGIATLCVAHFLLQRMFRHAAVAALAPVISLIMFWTAAGQNPTGLPHFFRSLREMTSGYSEAMSLPGPIVEVAAFAFASLWMLMSIVLMRGSTRRSRAFLLAVFSFALFIAYKAGFVRHDGHALISGSAALMAAMLLAASTRSRLAVAGLLVVASCTLVLYRGYRVVTPERVKLGAVATMDRVQRGLSERLAGGDALRTRYQAAIARLEAAAAFPALESSVDIYSFNQALLLASGLQWNRARLSRAIPPIHRRWHVGIGSTCQARKHRITCCFASKRSMAAFPRWTTGPAGPRSSNDFVPAA